MVKRFLSLQTIETWIVFVCHCNSITLDHPLAHTRARTRDPLHTSTTVTHEASALAEQGEPLLQGLRASDVTD